MSVEGEETIIEFTRSESIVLLNRAARACHLSAAKRLELDHDNALAYYLSSEPDCVTIDAVYEASSTEYQHVSFFTETFTHESGPTWEVLILHRTLIPLGMVFDSPTEGMAWFDREVMGSTK